MATEIDYGDAGTQEAELRRVFIGRAQPVVVSRSVDLSVAALLPPSDGDAYIVKNDDLTHPNEIAVWNDDEDEFLFIGPTEGQIAGWTFYVQDEGVYVKWDAVDWVIGAAQGPDGAVNDNVPTFNGTSGGILEDSGKAFSIDGTFAANSDAKVPTEKAIKTYVDSQVGTLANAMNFVSDLDCSANPNYPASDQGDVYRVSVAGKIGGGSGPNVEIGDSIICKADSASGTHAGVGANFYIEQGNIDGAVIGPASATSANLARYNGASGKLIDDSGVATSIDGTFASNSDAKLPTEKAIKTYVDGAVSAGGFVAASTTEVLTGTNTTKGVTPDALAALWEKGSGVALAGTMSFGEGGLFHITAGTGPITDIDFATAKDGREAKIICDVATTITHHATTLVCPGGKDLVLAAGDWFVAIQDNSDNVYILYAVHAAGGLANTPFEIEVACSDESTALTTGDNKVIFYAMMDAYITEVFTGLSTQSSSGSVTLDLNKNGSTMFSTKPSIDANEDTSLTGTAAALSTTTWAKGDKMAVDLDAAGTGAKGLKMVIRGLRK